MTMRYSTFGQKAKGPLSGYGSGNFVREMPEIKKQQFNDFSGGYDSSQAWETTNPNASRYLLDMEVTPRNSLIRAPGTTETDSIGGHNPTLVAVHGGLEYQSELLLFDPPFLGIKSYGGVTWYDVGLVDGALPYVTVTYGDTFIFSCMAGKVGYRTPKQTTISLSDKIPPGVTYAVFAGRLFVGGALISGAIEPLGYTWAGVGGFDDFNDIVNGSGDELLIADQSNDDRIVAFRTMGFDYMAMLCRHSVWLAYRTGDLGRPANPQPRFTGKGCVSERTARSVYGGVMYLSDEGVELFTGNDSVHVSKQIDSDLLPLDISRISEYNAAWNPHTQRYYLSTPQGYTYVFDVLRSRWYKRSMSFISSAAFAKQFAPTLWSQMTGQWNEQGAKTWSSMSPAEEDDPTQFFLGPTTIEKEDPSSVVYYNQPYTPSWRSRLMESEFSNSLITIKSVRPNFEGGQGTLDFFLPDISGNFQKVNLQAIQLPARTTPDVSDNQLVKTGRDLGVGLAITGGNPEIHSIEVEYVIRGQRIEPSTIAPSTDPEVLILMVPVLDASGFWVFVPYPTNLANVGAFTLASGFVVLNEGVTPQYLIHGDVDDFMYIY